MSVSFSLYLLTLLHSERPKLYGVLAILSAIGLREFSSYTKIFMDFKQKYLERNFA